ncbi:hypothetical protein Y032_0224g2693 [Ancylostoma ceylanicum]|nr:hypothetical protein Y032_0224g2693 [Ancylostoma ceylanicum]
MKYANLGLENDILVPLCLTKLEGYPKAVAEALPQRVTIGEFQYVLETQSAKFKENGSANQMKAYMDSKHLKMTKDVITYCLELEDLTRKAYPEATEEELSRTRGGKLVSQLINWPEYLQFCTTMELALGESAYEIVEPMAH